MHEEAEVLEHVTSQTLVNRLADYLNHPEFCPHGGVIPEDNQPIHEEKRQTLTDYPVGTKIRIARVLDEKELLDYLVSIDLNIQEEYTIFGGTGDLAKRKLYPSLFRLYKKGLLAERFAVIGTARREWTDEYYREIVRETIQD